MMAKYTVYVLWDKADAVPFGDSFSHDCASKRDAWEYVKRVKERAEVAGVLLHNVSIWRDDAQRVWSLHPVSLY